MDTDSDLFEDDTADVAETEQPAEIEGDETPAEGEQPAESEGEADEVAAGDAPVDVEATPRSFEEIIAALREANPAETIYDDLLGMYSTALTDASDKLDAANLEKMTMEAQLSEAKASNFDTLMETASSDGDDEGDDGYVEDDDEPTYTNDLFEDDK